MSLQDLKFTEEQLAGSDIASLPDRPGDAGMTAADLKARFDAIPKALLALGAFNSLIDRLSAQSGAEEIGSVVAGIDAQTLQGVVSALKVLHDTFAATQSATNTSVQEALGNRYTKDQANALLDAKFDTVKANEMVRSIEFNSANGVFTITTQGGVVSTIDTMLEKMPVSFSLENNQLVLTLDDGTKQTANLSAFIDTYTFQSGGTVQFSQNGKSISAEVKDESLELIKLTPGAQATLASYADRAETAKEGAEAAKNAAEAVGSTVQNSANAASANAARAADSEAAARKSADEAADIADSLFTAEVNNDGHLVYTKPDGTERDLGNVVVLRVDDEEPQDDEVLVWFDEKNDTALDDRLQEVVDESLTTLMPDIINDVLAALPVAEEVAF